MFPVFLEGARVAFIGDSITAANLVLPRVIDTYRDVSKNIRFFNCGVAGGTAEFAVTIFESDIMRYKPTHAVVSFGINDSDREQLWSPRSRERLDKLLYAYENYKKYMSILVDKLMEADIEVILCTPVPYDEYSESTECVLHGGYALMLGYAEFVRNLAREKGTYLYDQHTVLSKVLAEDKIISNDGIHPTDHGYFVLARELLGAQGIDIGEEKPIPERYAKWHSCVARLRKVLAAECMLVKDFDAPTEKKLAMMSARIEREDWGKPVFESFIRDYVKDKPHESELYKMIDELYESEIM